MAEDTVLETDVYNNEPGHAAKHNAVNTQVNWLTETVVALGEGGGAEQRQVLSDLRGFIQSGGVTTANPLVGIGDSHTDEGTSAGDFWDRLRDVRTQPGEGLEGVDPDAILGMGNNGQSLEDYLAGNGTNSLADTMALEPSVILACWLVNDVRLGGLGDMVAEIRDAGAALLVELYDTVMADANAPQYVVWRVPAPFTQESSVLLTIDEQIATDGLRAAYYEAARRRPASIVYDPQTRVFGTTSPAGDGLYYADAIHQQQRGYYYEADDFAQWIGATDPWLPALSREAANANPTAPWVAYPRDVEDPDRYVLIGSYIFNSSGSNFIRLEIPGDVHDNRGWTSVQGYVVPGNVAPLDLVHIASIDETFQIPYDASIGLSGANLQIASAAAVPDTIPAVASTVRIYRRRTVMDSTVGKVIDDTSHRFKRIGYVISLPANTLIHVAELSVTGERATQPADEWAAEIVSGDLIYVQGESGVEFTVGTDATASANSGQLRLTVASVDRSAWVGRVVVIVGTHA